MLDFPPSFGRGARWRLQALACAWLLALSLGAAAQTGARGGHVATEDRVKAAYLFKFRHYVEWPAQARARGEPGYVIAVAGADDVAEELAKVAAAPNPNNEIVTVKKWRAGDALDGVHVLFIGNDEWDRHAQLLAQARSRAILVVSETEGALAQGSIINFLLADERVRFEISLESAEKSGLKLNSRLLALATSVAKGRP